MIPDDESSDTAKTPNLINDSIVCLQFLSRLPIPEKWASHQKPDFERAGWAFPVAGIIIILPALITLVIGTALRLPNEMVALLAIIVQLLTTGALHEDGLADVVDGFGGGMDRERRLEIMQDNRIGAFGTAALILLFLARLIVLSKLLSISLFIAMSSLFAGQLFARAMQITFWRSLPNARKGGLSARFGQPSSKAANFALIIAIAVLPLPLFTGLAVHALIIAVVFTLLSTVIFRRLCLKAIGGQTGDTVGALYVIAEIAFLTGCLTFHP